jgi:hypothetical protein
LLTTFYHIQRKTSPDKDKTAGTAVQAVLLKKVLSNPETGMTAAGIACSQVQWLIRSFV